MQDIEFKHSIPIQLRFNDADSFGHINNSIFFNFYDLGKTDYFENVVGVKMTDNVGVVVAHAEIDFISPIILSDKVTVQTAIYEIGTKSFKMIQQIVNSKTGEVKCVCKTIMVGYNPRTNTSEPILDKWKQAINNYQNTNL